MGRNELSGEGLSVSLSDREVSAWGGLALFKQILDSLGCRRALSGWGLPSGGGTGNHYARQTA